MSSKSCIVVGETLSALYIYLFMYLKLFKQSFIINQQKTNS